jgi:hypothetical protein
VRVSYPERMNSEIPADQLERARARVDQLLEVLRRGTERLESDADSALSFYPDGHREEAAKG